MKVEDLEQAGEILKDISNYLIPFTHRRGDTDQLEIALEKLDDLIRFCQNHEFIYTKNSEAEAGGRIYENKTV